MTTKKLHQLVNVPDFRYAGDCSHIDYGSISTDADTKTISLLDAIRILRSNISACEENFHGKEEEIKEIADVIFELAELAITTNKTANTASYLSGLGSSTNGS